MKAFWSCATALGILAAGPAFAQQPAPAEGLGDIVVTAQRVQQTAQSAPVAVSVLQPDELIRQNVTRPEDLTRMVPALNVFNSGGANTVFFVRGVGNFTVNAYSDPAVAFNYDGVYIGRPTATSGSFYDLERIEVLKGPQGTLYGRNATAGAINVIPQKPKLGENSAELVASYGNYDAVNTQASVNWALGESAALRIAGNIAQHDGYFSDGTSEQNDSGARAQFLFEASPDFTFRLAADYSHNGGNTGAYYTGSTALNFATGKYVFTPAPASISNETGLHDGPSEAFLASKFISQVGRTAEPLNTYPRNSNDFWGVNAQIDYKTPVGTLTIQPAYRQSELDNVFTQPPFRGARVNESAKQSSIEARLAGEMGKIDYLGGVFLFREDGSAANDTFPQETLNPYQSFETATASRAVFGKLTGHITDTFSLTAAARYTQDKKDFNGTSDVYILFCGNPAPPQDFCPTLPLMPATATAAELRAFYTSRGIPITPVPLFVLPGFVAGTPFVLNAPIAINKSLKEDRLTYRLAAEWQVAPRSLLYASYETGYHSGGFSFARGLETYKPETIDAYTIGSKNRFFDNRLQLNVEGFYWKYEDQQFSQFGYDLGTPPATVFLTRNIGNSTNKGVDVDVDYLLFDNTRLSASAQYIDATYDSFVYLTPNQGLPPQTSCPFTSATDNGQAVWRVDCSGFESFNTPKWSFNLNVEQTIPLGDYQLVVGAGTRYRDDVWTAQDYNPWTRSEADFQSNAVVTYGPTSEKWFASAFVNNIEDHRRLVNVSTSNGFSTVTATTTAPRTYGVRLGAKF